MKSVDTAGIRVYSCKCGKVIRVKVKQKEEDEPAPEPDEAPPAPKPLRSKVIKPRNLKHPLVRYWDYYHNTYGTYGLVMLGLCIFWLLGLLGTCALPPAVFLLVGVAVAISFGGYCWLVVIAFQDSPMAGILILLGPFIPFIGGLLVLIWAIMNINDTWKALALQLLGLLMSVTAIVALFLSPWHWLLHR
jgi:hypothetical protein